MAGLSAIELPKYSVENLVFRTIYLISNQEFATEYVEKSTPLVLGSDITCHSSLDPKNHCRCHLRYGKKGLASKVNFKDKRIDGISNGNALWFYTIPGMFKLSFECCNEEMQRICLQYFEEMWMQNRNSPPLPEHLSLSLYSVASENGHLQNVIESLPENEIILTHTGPDNTCKESSGSKSLRNEMSKELGPNDERCSSNDQTSITLTHAHLLPHPCSETLDYTACASRILSSVAEVNKFVDTICSLDSNKTSDEHSRRLFSNLMHVYRSECDVKHDGMFSDFLKFYLDNITSSIETDASEHIVYDYSQKSERLLNCISAWLGNQFNDLQPQIVTAVDQFKQEHIDRIDNLPPPRNLVKQLFPVCMVTFIKHWMAPPKEVNGGDRRKRLKLDVDLEESRYHVLQMALEFTNNTLISGVAHVVYSRLLHS